MKVYKSMPNFLAIDTSTDICSLSLKIENTVFSLNNNSKDKKNNQIILDSLYKLLKDSNASIDDLDAIILSAGPGSFTGLRIATSVAQALAYSKNIKIIRLSSLQIIAEFLRENLNNIDDSQKIFVAQDARKNEIYFSEYTKQNLLNFDYIEEQLLTEQQVCDYLMENQKLENNFFLGNAWDAFAELKSLCDKYSLKYREVLFPDVQYCFKLAEQYYSSGKLLEPHDALPIYIRNNVVN